MSSSPIQSAAALSMPSSVPRPEAVNKQSTVANTQPADRFVSSQPVIPVQVSQATELANEGYLLTPEQLEAAMKKEKNYHYGQTPEGLRQALAQPEQKIWSSMDHLGKQLYANRLARGESQQIQLKKGGAATVEYLGEGHTSVVYKLTAGPSTYALKVFRPGTAGTNIPYNDVVNGAFLTTHNVKDASKLHMANPAQNWTLMEYVSPEASVANRGGKTLEELRVVSSDGMDKNCINGILIDHGGTLTVPHAYIPDPQSVADALKQIKPESLLKRFLK